MIVSAAVTLLLASLSAVHALAHEDGQLQLPTESPRSSRTLLESDYLGPSDSLASQVAFSGGAMQYAQEASNFYLTLHGPSDKMMVAKDPTDPTTARMVDQRIVSDTFPRFAVLVINNSDTRTTTPDITFMSMIVRQQIAEAVDGKNGERTTYEVELWNHDINNSTGTAGLVPASDLGEIHFNAGMLMVDLVFEAGSELSSMVNNFETLFHSAQEGANIRSLKHMVDHNGLRLGPAVPQFSANGTEVRAQGLFTTAFLGPFNAWAWACCAYKTIEHWTIAWAFPMSWVTYFICCV